jgi:hypothetical protein
VRRCGRADRPRSFPPVVCAAAAAEATLRGSSPEARPEPDRVRDSQGAESRESEVASSPRDRACTESVRESVSVGEEGREGAGECERVRESEVGLTGGKVRVRVRACDERTSERAKRGNTGKEEGSREPWRTAWRRTRGSRRRTAESWTASWTNLSRVSSPR